MKFSSATIAAVAASLPALVSAHVRMISPSSVFASNDGNDQAPLDPSGSDYPCTVTTGSGGPAPEYAPGSQQSIGLVGSAVHGGGSCQICITYDNPPTKNSVFRVLQSFEGSCPISAPGNLPDNPSNPLPGLNYYIPSDMPFGDAVIAWTWFNNIGNREMYMRCAPVKITGNNQDYSSYDSLPEMFKANIGGGCSTPPNTNIRFPNPGKNVIGSGNADPIGSCGSSAPVPDQPTPDPSPTEEGEIPDPVPTEEGEIPDPVPTEEGEIPDPVPTEEGEIPDPYPTKAPILVDIPPPYPVTPTPSNVQPTPESQPGSLKCQGKDGHIVCISESKWGICDHGELVDMGATAAGVACKNDEMVLARRSVRFSSEHFRRRHHLKI